MSAPMGDREDKPAIRRGIANRAGLRGIVQKPGGTDSEHLDNVIRLDAPVEVPGQAEPQAPTRPGRGHGLAIAGMSLCALTGVFALLAFITVRWPGTSGETLKIVFIFSGVGFMTCASMAVFFAMKDTYARPPRDSGK